MLSSLETRSYMIYGLQCRLLDKVLIFMNLAPMSIISFPSLPKEKDWEAIESEPKNDSNIHVSSVVKDPFILGY